MDDHSRQIARITKRLRRLNAMQLGEVERLASKLDAQRVRQQSKRETGDQSPHSKDWPHAPVHRLTMKGTYVVTAGTLHKEHFFRDVEIIDWLETELLTKASQYRWQLEAWAVFSNHYHFVGHAIEDAKSLKQFLTHLHADAGRKVNDRDGTAGRQVWYNFWETELTFEKSYLARLNYVRQNAVKHGLVPVANQYRWCSAAWFERTATPAQVKTIYSFKTDKIRIVDDFEVVRVR